ncbi:hypothetical protein BH09ACT12_BH09ACT12_22550 [soil metagenome]
MSTTLSQPTATTSDVGGTTYDPIPFSRLVSVELRKMFDTRSGFWLMASIAMTAVVASGAVIAFAADDAITYDTFAAAIGFPMTVVLPMIAVLSVTSEWSQRTGLTTFTFVPHRGRVIRAKLACTVAIGVVGIVVAAGIGALGNLLGASIAGVDVVWDLSALQLSMIALATVINMLMGFTVGVLLRNSAAAIVAYFVYCYVLAGLTMLLAESQQWFADAQPWVDLNYAQGALFDAVPSAEQWANLGVASLIWLVLPLAVGLRIVVRSEVK